VALSEVLPGLYRLELGFVNAYLVSTRAGLVLVDTGMPGNEGDVMAAIAALAGPRAHVALIVVTHAHLDHSGSLAALRDATGAPAAMHPLDARLVRAGLSGRPMEAAPGMQETMADFLGPPLPVTPTAIDLQLVPGASVPGIPELSALHVPGHSAGQVALRWNQHGGVLVAADAVDHSGCRLQPPPIAEDLAVAAATVTALADLEFEVAVFGHGPPIANSAGAALRALARSGVPQP
jgi:glyoxylase-like metal-dependent hydrolase (beta-lactamase superfamily II)